MLTITLTDKEAEVLDNYIFRKISRLEESSLTDAVCYVQLSSVHRKIQQEQFNRSVAKHKTSK